jgi:protein-export membrane protein SecD
VKRTRGLWASIIFVLVLTGASLIGFATGYLEPILGLDLEGGVSVTLSAPGGTPAEVMDRARTNIANRVDAFGVGEPDISVSGDTIEVQIPGLSEATIEERAETRHCLVGPDGENYGCAPSPQEADDALAELTVEEQVAEACLVADDGTQLECFPTEELARSGKAAMTVVPSTGGGDGSCLVSATGEQLECYPTRREAQAAKNALQPQVTQRTFCVTEGGGTENPATPTATPTPADPTAFSALSLGANELPCGLGSRSEAQVAADAASVQTVDSLFCVISSADRNLGCFIDRVSAEERRRSTGQQRLLDVIGQTARLEQRPVLAIVPPTDPSYAATPVTCPTDEERQTDECSFSALENEEVVYEDDAGNRFRLGPTVIAGGDIVEANAILGGATGSEWSVSFRLSGDASGRFADATTTAVSLPEPQNQIAIVVDRSVISAPTVQSPITGGTGDITGGFSENEARDLATVLNSGALPVELTRQQVQTVSPTLGAESLRQGIVAGVVGLVLLFLYLLFYYRLLGIVAWFGMSIWAILAIAIISLAGIQFGYALTLAGVAGLVISLGVTADSYIVFFERLKDEVRSGKTARAAVQPAFARSYKTIIAADVVAGIAAVVLYVTAVSSVRGFALTLGVATLLDLFVVWFFKRPTVFLVAQNRWLVSLKGFGLEAGVAGGRDGEPEGVGP